MSIISQGLIPSLILYTHCAPFSFSAMLQRRAVERDQNSPYQRKIIYSTFSKGSSNDMASYYKSRHTLLAAVTHFLLRTKHYYVIMYCLHSHSDSINREYLLARVKMRLYSINWWNFIRFLHC